jgi:hypothetical protein
MTTEPIFDALEICLQALDQGADIESCLVRYPALADELRPILVAAVQARAVAAPEVPADVARRGRARVLQAAAEMREQRSVVPVLPFWRRKGFFGARFYRLAATTAVVIAFLLTGGTGLVNASNGALPGDKLYPVKRGWEGVQLAFVSNPETKAELEHKFEHERVQEIEELYSENRIEQVNFEGVVEAQQTGALRINGLDVAVDDETSYNGEVIPGATVRIVGETDDGVINATQITLILTPSVIPSSTSTSTPTPATLQGTTPEGGGEFEGSRTPEAGENSGSSGLIKPEGSKEQEVPEKSDGGNEAGISPTATQRPGLDDSSSISGSGGDSQPSTLSGTGGDSGQLSTEGGLSSESSQSSTEVPDGTDH